jgi:hypothetical protein
VEKSWSSTALSTCSAASFGSDATIDHDLLIRNDGHKYSKMVNRAEKERIRRERDKEEKKEERKKASEKKEENKREGGRK